jgi:hypothetical protein
MAKTVLLLAMLQAAVAMAAEPKIAVEVSPASINAVAGERAAIRVTLARAGRLKLRIVDRDGFVVRTIATADARAGVNAFTWDGRADDHAVVPDEAYSLRIDWSNGKESASFFPANEPAAMTSIPVRYYSPQNGTIVYDLPRASRVHLQAGTAVRNAKSGEMEGPVLKTVVNREPRSAGRIAEQWSGLDESGTVLVRELPNFVLAVAATPLPESSIIAYGNRGRDFLAYAAARGGASLFASSGASHLHHAGLDTFGDVSPPLRLQPLNAKWSEKEHLWIVAGKSLQVRATVTGASAAAFARQPATVYQFVGTHIVAKQPSRGDDAMTLTVPASRAGSEVAVVAVNWRSDYGAVAANALRVRLAPGAQ